MIIIKAAIFLLFFYTLSSFTLFDQFTLTIEITELKNSKGQILLEFSNDKGEKISGFIQDIENKKCIIVIKNLKQGNYSFKYFHDENQNQELDVNWIGIPKEGFGFANNAKGLFGPPSLKKTIFSLNSDTTLKCTPTYF